MNIMKIAKLVECKITDTAIYSVCSPITGLSFKQDNT